MIEGWNAVGLDVATFGNHEFDFGAAVLAERVRESRFPWLSANVLDRATGQPFGGARRGRVWELRRRARRRGRAHHARGGAHVQSRPGPAVRRPARGGRAPPSPRWGRWICAWR